MLHKNLEKAISFLKNNKRTALTLLVVFIFVDIFFINMNLDILTFSVLLLYIIFIKIFRIKSRRTFLLCLALLMAMFIDFLFTGTSVSTEKAAVWLILFLIVGISQRWKE